MSKTMDSVEKSFKQKLSKKRGLKQTSADKCDAVLDFCPIVSRAGTDISAALDRHNIYNTVVLVVLHQSLDDQKFVPDSNKAVNRDNTLAVDCLFNEDVGLLQCQKNEEAYDTIANYLTLRNLTSYAYYKDLPSPYLSSDFDATNRDSDRSHLFNSTGDSLYLKFLTDRKCWVVIIVVLLLLVLILCLLKTFNIIFK